MGKKLLLFLACMLMTASMAFAQTQIAGTVVDAENGEPLIGVAVRVPGTNTGVLTDVNGKFSVTLPQGQKNLNFSFMGMKPASLPARNGMVVRLETDTKAMDEVMVVAYGTATRSSFTGSAAVIGSETIEKQVATNVTSALAGTAAGVQYMSSNGDPASNGPTIRIRGIGSINASTSPLYVVDGVPYDGNINDINPADVENMTVLKDAASTALYGSRAANGVVIITTKKGRTQKADISFDAKWGSNSRLMPRYDIVSNPGQYYEMMFERMYNTNIAGGMTAAQAYQNANNRIFNEKDGGLGYQVFTVPDGENLIGTNMKLNPHAKLGYSDGQYYYTPDDWYDASFSNNLRQEYNINLSGSSDKLSYYGGVGFLDDGGVVANSDMKRYNGRMNVNYQARKWLAVNTNLNFTHMDATQPSYTTDSWASSGNLFYAANNIGPIYPLYVRNADGTVMTDANGVVYDANQTNFRRPGFLGNPFRDNVLDKDKSYRDAFNGNWGVTLTPVAGLNLTANMAVANTNTRNNYLSSRFGSSAATDGYASASHSRLLSVIQQYMAEYKTDFNGTKHNFGIVAGYEQRKITSQSLSGENDHLFNPYVGELGNAYGKENRKVSSNTQHYMNMGYLTRAQYSYDDRYFLDASYRRDASSRWAPGHRWGNFGSVAAAWQLNKENFLKDVKWIDLLKLKASWGSVGNEGLGNYYVYADMYGVSYNPETGAYSTQLTQKGNPELTWEDDHDYNVGVDFNLFKNRLNGTVEFFYKKTGNMLFYKDFPLSSGYGTSVQLPVNVGDLMNRGIEFTVEGVAVRTKDVEWSLNANLTHYKNKILTLADEYKEDGIKYSNSILREGGSVYQTYMYKYAGVNDKGAATYYKDVTKFYDNSNNEITEAQASTLGEGNYTKKTVQETTTDATSATRYECGTTLPKVYGGFGTSLTFKGFDLSAIFSYSLGGKIYDGTYQALMTSDNATCKGMNIHKDLLNAWTKENTNTDVPLWKDNMWGNLSQSACDYFLTSSNYLSINNVTFGYSLPKSVLDKAKIGSLRVYVSGENLAVFSCRKGLDPRFTTGLGSMTSGSGRNGDYYSAMRSIVAGVNVKF